MRELTDTRDGLAALADDARADVIVADADLFEKSCLPPPPPERIAPDLLLVFERVGESAIDLSLRSHAHGCLEFEIGCEALVRAATAVACDGELWFPRWMMEPFYQMALAASAQGTGQRTPAPAISSDSDLTEREVDVIEHARRGLTNKQIAKELAISPSTVKKHLHNALIKHGIRRRRQLFR